MLSSNFQNLHDYDEESVYYAEKYGKNRWRVFVLPNIGNEVVTGCSTEWATYAWTFRDSAKS